MLSFFAPRGKRRLARRVPTAHSRSFVRLRSVGERRVELASIEKAKTMSAMDDREKAFEKRSAVNAELRFKVESLRHKLCGQWCAQLMGYDAEASQRFAQNFVAQNVAIDDDESLFTVLRGSLIRAHVEIPDHRIRQKMVEARAQARDEVLGKE